MSSENKNVVMMERTAQKMHEDFKGLKSSLGFLDWTLQVQTLIQSSGLPVGDDLTRKDAPLSFGSTAHRLGHKTIGDFITASEENMGVSWSWDKWTSFTTAFRYKSFYDIHLTDPFEIIAQFEDVKKILGREPANSAEFHSIKEEAFNNQKEELTMKHNGELRDLNTKIMGLRTSESALKSELSSAMSKIKDHEKDISHLSKSRNTTLSALDETKSNLAKLQAENELLLSEVDFKIKNAKEQGEMAALEQYQKDKIFLAKEFEKEKSLISQGYELKFKEAEKRAKVAEDELTSISSTMVSKSDYSFALSELDSEKQKVQRLLLSAHETESKWLTLAGEADEQKVRIKTLQGLIESQSTLIENMKMSSASGNVSSREISQLEEKISKLEDFARDFKEKALLWKGKHDDKSNELTIISEQAKILKEELDVIKNSTGSSKSSKTTLLAGIFLGLLPSVYILSNIFIN